MSEEKDYFDEMTVTVWSTEIRHLFCEIRNCLKMRDTLDYEEESETRRYMREQLNERQSKLEDRLLELTGLQIGDFDFHVE